MLAVIVVIKKMVIAKMEIMMTIEMLVTTLTTMSVRRVFVIWFP